MGKYALKISLLAMFFIPFLSVSAHTSGLQEDPWWGKDKAEHLSASFIMVSFLRSPNFHHPLERKDAFLLALSTGILKESWDLFIRKENFSYKDLLYDFCGSFLGSL